MWTTPTRCPQSHEAEQNQKKRTYEVLPKPDNLIRYRHSVPTAHAYTTLLVKGVVEEVVIVGDGVEIARHPRSYAAGDMVCDPRHYLALIETKPGALDQAAPLQGWDLPPAFAEMRRLLEARSGRAGKREYIQILRLTEIAPPEVVASAVIEAIRRRVVSFDAVADRGTSGQARPTGLSLSADR